MIKHTKSVYEIIQNIPVDSMIALSFTQLRGFEAQLKEEVIAHTLKRKQKTKEYHRAVLALRWVQGVIRIKTTDEVKTNALINDLKRVFNQESIAFQSDDIKSELR